MKAILTLIIPFLQITTLYAADRVITSDYLLGRWSPEGKAGCASGRATHVVFHANGTLEAGRGRTVSTVGFWNVAKDRVVLHLLVAPSDERDAHPFYQQSYHYQYMAPTVLAVNPNSIEFTKDTGFGAGNRSTLTRCR